jgi:hypothetical protein
VGANIRKPGVSLAKWLVKGYVLIWPTDLKTNGWGGLGFSPLAETEKSVGRHHDGGEKLTGVG